MGRSGGARRGQRRTRGSGFLGRAYFEYNASFAKCKVDFCILLCYRKVMPAKKPIDDDELKRLTFWIVESVAKQLKRNAKAKKQKLPVYLANVVQAGMRAEERRGV